MKGNPTKKTTSKHGNCTSSKKKRRSVDNSIPLTLRMKNDEINSKSPVLKKKSRRTLKLGTPSGSDADPVVVWKDSPHYYNLRTTSGHGKNDVTKGIRGFVDRLSKAASMQSPQLSVKLASKFMDPTTVLEFERPKDAPSLQSWLIPHSDDSSISISDHSGSSNSTESSDYCQNTDKSEENFLIKGKVIKCGSIGNEDALLSILDKMDAEISDEHDENSKSLEVKESKIVTPARNEKLTNKQFADSPAFGSPLSEDSLRLLDRLEYEASQQTKSGSNKDFSELQKGNNSMPSRSPTITPKGVRRKNSYKGTSQDTVLKDSSRANISGNTGVLNSPCCFSTPTSSNKYSTSKFDNHNKSKPRRVISPRNESDSQGFCRYMVLEVDRYPAERRMLLRLCEDVERNAQETTYTVLQDWFDLEIHVGDIINVIFDTNEHQQINQSFREQKENDIQNFQNSVTHRVVDNSQNMIIIHPDILISPTSVSSSFVCPRRAVLQDCLRMTSSAHPKAVLGNLKHELFERALMKKRTDREFLDQQIEDIIEGNILLLVEAGLSEKTAIEELRIASEDVVKWIFSFYRTNKESFCVSADVNMDIQPRKKEKVRVSIKNVIATEGMMYSIKYGLKGAADAIVEALLQMEGEHNEVAIMPIELKTGNRKYGEIDHRAQVLLYTLLLNERFNSTSGNCSAIHKGLLVYIPGPQTEGIVAHRQFLRSLLIARNRLASSMNQLSEFGDFDGGVTLPPVLRDRHQCERCFQINECMLYHAACEGGSAVSSGLDEIFSHRMSHLSKKHLKYFHTWNRMIDLEKRLISKNSKSLWLSSAQDREDQGNCIGDLSLNSRSQISENTLIFKRRKNQVLENSVPISLLDIKLREGDSVIISAESKNHKTRLYHIASGKLSSLKDVTVEVNISQLIPQVFLTDHSVLGPDPIWRIDKHVLSTGLQRAKENLLRLFIGETPEEVLTGINIGRLKLIHREREKFRKVEKDYDRVIDFRSNRISEGDSRRRELIVDLEPPIFIDISEQELFAFHVRSTIISHCDSDVNDKQKRLKKSYEELNSDQKNAVKKVLSGLDYTLILGMPGTGKTSTIAFTVRLLLAKGYSVLVTSYTHSAVDNLLLKLLEFDLPMLRIGSKHQIHPSIKRFTLEDNNGKNIKTTEDVELLFNSIQLVGATCLSTNHILFKKRRFDFCIVDEASQITQPMLFGALSCANSFVLVGDHYQLPPLVIDADARCSGMNVSLFRCLSEAHPSAVQELTYQYRMHQNIMSLSNSLIYAGKLRCGNMSVAKQSLAIPKWKQLVQKFKPNATHRCNWVLPLLNPYRHVVFANTDNIKSGANAGTAQEECAGKIWDDSTTTNHRNGISNATEAILVSMIIKSLIFGGISPDCIGAVSPYRSQIRLLKQLLKEYETLEIATIDKYQGKDKEVMVLSMVRSNPEQMVGELWKDWRRMNVAITRAKTKLIMIGSRNTLSGFRLLKSMISLLDDRKWVYNLPPDACKLDNFKNEFSEEMRILASELTTSRLKLLSRESDKNTFPSKNQVDDIENIVPSSIKARTTSQLQTRFGSSIASSNILDKCPVTRNIIEENKP